MWSLAVYRAIRETGVEEDYATELCTDYLWKAYKRQVGIQRLIARVFVRDGQKQMNMMQRMFLRVPLAAPGYDCELTKTSGGFAYDIRRCPVRDYYVGQGEEALRFFRNSWCTLDYPLAEYLVEGGKYERTHTLSAGDTMCDMRWVVEKIETSDVDSEV